MASLPNRQPQKQGFLHGAAILTVGALLAKLIGALFKIPLARILGAEGAGHFSVAYNIYIVLLNVSSTGLPLAVSRLVSEANTLERWRQVQSIHRVSLCIFLLLGGVCSGVMFFGAQPLADWMRDPDAVYAIRFLSPAVLFVCVCSAFRGFFQGQQYMTPTALAQVLEALSKLLIGLAAVAIAKHAGWNAAEAAGAAILGVTVGSGLGCAYFFWQYRSWSKESSAVDCPSPILKTAGKILRLAIPITIGATGLQIFNALGSRIILGRLQDTLGYSLADASALYGIYTMAQTLYLLPSALVQPLTVSIIPAVTESLSLGSNTGARNKEESSLRIAAIIAVPAGMGLSVLASPIQQLLYGYDAQVLAVAGPTLTILGIASIGYCLILMTNTILQAHGKAMYTVLSTIAGGMSNLAVSYALVSNPKIHILGAAFGILAYSIVTLVCNLIGIRKLITSPPRFLPQISKPILAATVMSCAAGWLFQRTNHTIAAISAAACIYLLLVIILKMLTWDDLQSLPKSQWIAKLLHIKPIKRQEDNK